MMRQPKVREKKDVLGAGLVNLEGGFLLNTIYRREKVFFIIIIIHAI